MTMLSPLVASAAGLRHGAVVGVVGLGKAGLIQGGGGSGGDSRRWRQGAGPLVSRGGHVYVVGGGVRVGLASGYGCGVAARVRWFVATTGLRKDVKGAEGEGKQRVKSEKEGENRYALFCVFERELGSSSLAPLHARLISFWRRLDTSPSQILQCGPVTDMSTQAHLRPPQDAT